MKRPVFVFVVLSVLASLLNYAVYPSLSRILPDNQFVNITVALSIFTQIATFLSSIIAITIGLSKSRKKNDIAKDIEFLQYTLFKFFAVVVVAFIIVSPLLASLINIPEAFVVPISLMMLAAIPIAVISGFLNGRGKLEKLGLVAVVSASSQVVIASIGAAVTKSGVMTMIFMALSQIITIIILYQIFKNDGLPRIAISQKLNSLSPSNSKRLVTYTLISSLAIMVINLLQIEDLLIIKVLNSNQVRLYTDIYLISRIVFFACMIFIWPFLSEISLTNKNVNYRALTKLLGYFIAISGITIIGVYLFEGRITKILFNSSYSSQNIELTTLLSIIYKFALLIITAVVLYFTVFRSYTAVTLAAISGLSIFGYSLFVNGSYSINSILIGLDVISLFSALLCVIMFTRHRLKPNPAI